MMTTFSGKYHMPAVTCLNCSVSISLFPCDSKDKITKCRSCGAMHKILNVANPVSEEHIYIKIEYDTYEFSCIYDTYKQTCLKICPSPYMFCKDHSSKEEEEKTRKSISYAKTTQKNLEDKLITIKKSRKTWMIMELSGIDE